MTSQGSNAVKNGLQFEDQILIDMLNASKISAKNRRDKFASVCDLQQFTWKEFDSLSDFEKPDKAIVRNRPYDKPFTKSGKGHTEFSFWINKKWIRIECKFQDGPGSVMDKFTSAFRSAVRDMPENEVYFVVAGKAFDEDMLLKLRAELDYELRIHAHAAARGADVHAYNSQKNVKVLRPEDFMQILKTEMCV